MSALAQATDGPLYIVTAQTAGERSGCLVGFVTQCSIEPERFLVCISRANHTYEVASRAGFLGIHLLGADQEKLARLFGEETGDATDKFAACRWQSGTNGAPLLNECVAWSEAKILECVRLGDHDGFVVEQVEGGRSGHSGILRLGEASDFAPGHPADDPLR